MGYIKPPEPADNVVIVPAEGDQSAFTWGDHRAMLKILKDLEDSDEAVAMAHQRLRDALNAAGMIEEPELICEFCHRKISEPHEVECQDSNDPSLWAKREAGGYQYLSATFEVVETTSVPMTDQEALEYFGIVQLMFPADPDLEVKYIMRREVMGTKYEMMPWIFDKETWEVSPIERLN